MLLKSCSIMIKLVHRQLIRHRCDRKDKEDVQGQSPGNVREGGVGMYRPKKNIK